VKERRSEEEVGRWWRQPRKEGGRVKRDLMEFVAMSTVDGGIGDR